MKVKCVCVRTSPPFTRPIRSLRSSEIYTHHSVLFMYGIWLRMNVTKVYAHANKQPGT